MELDPETIARNARKPSAGPEGTYVADMMKTANRFVIRTAVELSDIQPDHHVLEVGFGPGLGLREAFNRVKYGSGQVFGIDISECMLEAVSHEMRKEIDHKRVHLSLNSVDAMPFPDRSFHRVFHCNCYYFWDDPNTAAVELHRVLKPSGSVVTTYSANAVRNGEEKGWLKYGNSDPQIYMNALEKAGFVGVRKESVPTAITGVDDHIEAIYAFVKKT